MGSDPGSELGSVRAYDRKAKWTRNYRAGLPVHFAFFLNLLIWTFHVLLAPR
jgi:hypothetical protein